MAGHRVQAIAGVPLRGHRIGAGNGWAGFSRRPAPWPSKQLLAGDGVSSSRQDLDDLVGVREIYEHDVGVQ